MSYWTKRRKVKTNVDKHIAEIQKEYGTSPSNSDFASESDNSNISTVYIADDQNLSDEFIDSNSAHVSYENSSDSNQSDTACDNFSNLLNFEADCNAPYYLLSDSDSDCDDFD